MSHLLSLVATSLDHSGKVCLSSVHSNASVTPTYACVWRFQLKAETALEITGRKAMGPRNITADGRACCMLRTSRQSAHLRRQRGACFSSTSGCCATYVFVRFRSSRPAHPKAGVLVQLLQVFVESCISVKMSSTLKTNKDLDPIYVLVFVIV